MRPIGNVALALALAAPVPAAAQDAEAEAVRQTLTAFAEFTQTKDLAGMETLFAPDAWVQIIEGAGVNRGWSDYRDHHVGPEFRELDSLRYRYFEIEPQVRGTTAWAPFRYELGAITPRGRLDLEGRGTAVLEKREGRWVIVHLHTSGRRRATAR